MKEKIREIKESLQKTRSIRKFKNEEEIPSEILRELVELTRYCPSAGNKQPLRFLCVNNKDACRFISEHIRWAARLKNWNGPEETEKPSAYVLIFVDRRICEKAPYDSGIAAHAILMGAVGAGLSGCMLGNVDREELTEYFSLDRTRYFLDLVVAVGKPGEESVIEDAAEDIAYYRDSENLFHVPKRTLTDLLL